MQRPAGVTALVLVFFLMGAYIFGVGVVILISPQTLSSGFILLRGLEMGGPYTALLIGAVWVLIGWGLFGLHDWARLAAMLVITVGLGLLVARLAMSASYSHRSLVWGAVEVFVRLAMVWYLFSAPIAELFSKSKSVRAT
jgi:hypothetical protein